MSGFRPAPEQIEAMRPDRSNWVGANAGSGKTHVLTQRVARLLLAGAAPQKILCLTYTKAAAAEMQTRLFRTLGGWAMEDGVALGRLLADLAGEGDPETDPERLADARRLFARAIETPGGLKIQTIHAFCDSLLRRFPLEAGVSPRFEVADDRQSTRLRAAVRAEMALAAEAGTDDAYDRVARILTEGRIDQLTDAVLARRAPFRVADVEPLLAALFGPDAMMDRLAISHEALAQLDIPTFRALRSVLLDKGKSYDKPVGEALPEDPTSAAVDPAGCVERLVTRVLTQKGEARSPRGFPSAEVKKVRPSAEDELRRLTDWALATRERLMVSRMAARTRDLYAFAGSLLARLERTKAALGLLDFDDLVARAERLLTDSHMRAWVLYKLDQGIDHILVDEAQDTSPQQWAVIAAIAEEFLSGEGARTGPRSLFVVGDDKQSIYSFQGAEPRSFGAMRAHFGQRLADLGTPLGQPGLRTSYRSAPAILDFVDAVFQGPAAEGLTVGDDRIEHRAHRERDQGRVDLWPLVEPAPTPEAPHWSAPVDTVPPTHPKERLAEAVAAHIADLVSGAHRPARDGQPGAPVVPEDILVLVRKRDRLAHGIIRGLKARGVPVAGADRLSLVAELAVKDLLALARVALMPSDDLSLAALLRSPLCGLSEEDLFQLAHGRESTLWQAVQQSADHAATAAFLQDMASRAGFLRPYEFLEHALVHHGGRQALLARLGSEAEDPIDELLSQALSFEMRETPSLAGFIDWIEAADIAVKREMDRGTGEVRVMTIHGAKGLEAPIVILPDTLSAGGGGAGRPVLLPTGDDPGLTVWAASRAEDDSVAAAARAEADAREEAELRRLLYVALTRAEDWLILCGAQPGKSVKVEGTWYGMLEAAMAGCAPVAEHPSPTGDGTMRRFETGREAVGDAPRRDGVPALAPVERPGWLSPAPKEVRIERGAPSDPVAEAEAQGGGVGRGRAEAMRRGTAIHFLLEHAGGPGDGVPMEAFAAAFPDLDPATRAALHAEAVRVLEMPEAAEIFAPGTLAEVPVAIDPPGEGPRMIGRIDRLLVTDQQIVIIDFKTDPVPPDAPEAIDGRYLAQLGAYAAGLAPSWPGREIALRILWTAGPRLMPVSPDAAAEAFRTTRFARNAGS